MGGSRARICKPTYRDQSRLILVPRHCPRHSHSTIARLMSASWDIFNGLSACSPAIWDVELVGAQSQSDIASPTVEMK